MATSKKLGRTDMAIDVSKEPPDWKEYYEWLLKKSPIRLRSLEDARQGVMVAFLSATEIVSAERLSPNTGRLTVRFPVMHEFINPGGTLQGGLQGAIADIFTSWVFAYSPGWAIHVSTTMTTSYLRAALEGEILLLDSEVIYAGKRTGLSRGTLKRERDGALISTCEHYKQNVTDQKPRI